MGHSGSKRQKMNKNHDKQKMFQLGISVGRNDLNLESHFQMQYHGKTIKNYTPVENHSPVNNVQESIPGIEEEE